MHLPTVSLWWRECASGPVRQTSRRRVRFQSQFRVSMPLLQTAIMTRAEMLTRISELQAQLDSYQPDPLKSDTDNASRSAVIARSLASFQERLKRLEAHR
jgi:hypothetical protein